MRRGFVIAAVWAAVLCQSAAGQESQGKEAKGLPPRATPADYQSHTQAGAITLAAEFAGHSVPTFEATLTNEDYVAVEVALFGPPEARAKLSYEDFSLRINGKKAALPGQPYTFVFKSLKDPEFAEPAEAKAKTTSIGTGGQGQNDPPLPTKVHIPIEVERVMEQRVQKAALPEGEHALPAAGLIFFRYGGKNDGIRSLELIYTGAAGKATLPLHP